MTNERRKQVRKKRKARNKNKVIIWFKNLSKKKKAALITAAILLLLFIALVCVVAWKFSLLNTEKIDEDEIIVNEFEDDDVGVGYTNFVLFGGDSRSGDVDKNLNTDSIIIISLNNETKEVKMVSVYRDTLMDLSDGTIRKCNAAYSRGGAKQAINMLNMNLDLDIKKYVTVDFGAVTDVIDMLGGIEVDVSEAEWQAVNNYIDETARVAGKKANHLTHAGLQTLDGVQATTYARIRKGVGDDYARTERQRLVIQKAVEKAMKSDLATLNKIVDAVFPQVSTNLTMTEILSYAKSFTKYKIGETTGFPFEKGSGTIPGRGSCVYPVTLKENVTMLHEFLYGTIDYSPSAKVVSISGEIANIVGDREVEPNTTWVDNGQSTTGTDDGNNSSDDNTTSNVSGGGSTTDGDNSNTGGDSGTTGGENNATGGDNNNTGGSGGTTGGNSGTTEGDGDTTGGDGSTEGDGSTNGGDSGTTEGDEGATSGDGGANGAGGSTTDGNTPATP